MVEWYIGVQNNFAVSTGKFGKYFKRYLPQDFYKMYKKTYSDSDYENLWNAVFTMCDLFRILARKVAEKLNVINLRIFVEFLGHFCKFR